jgi:hypothetical protein
MFRNRPIAVAAAALTAVSLAGCSSKPQEAVTISSGAPSASVSSPGSSSTSPPESSSSAPAPVQTVTPLSKAQLTAALPPAKALGPKGWKIVKKTSGPASGSKDKISPAACQAVYGSLSPTLPSTKHASADRSFQGSVFGPFVEVTTTSYTTVPADGAFDKLAAAVSSCPSFTSTSPKGVKSTWQAKPLKFPNVGDQTFALRMTGVTKSGGLKLAFTVDLAVAVVGATSVSVMNAGIGKLFLPSSTLTAMNATLDRLPS